MLAKINFGMEFRELQREVSNYEYIELQAAALLAPYYGSLRKYSAL